MTPTEQDKELREAILSRLQHAYYNRHTDGIAGVYAHAPAILENYTDEIVQLITADRERVALEARLDELERVYPQLQKHHSVSGEGNYYYDDRIAELKAQQEEPNDR